MGILVFLILFLVTTLTKRMKMVFFELLPSSDVHSSPLFLQDMLLILLILYVVVFKCKVRSLSLSGYTRALQIASPRSSRTKELVLFSREQVPTLCVLLEQLWFWF